MAKTTETVDFFDWIQEISAGNKHFSLQKGKCKKELFMFLKENAFFGVSTLEHAKLDETLSVSRTDLQKLEPGLALWIRSYGAGNDEKLILLTDRLHSLVPKTGNLFADYIKSVLSQEKLTAENMELSQRNNRLIVENRYLRKMLRTYLYPDVANEILVQEKSLKGSGETKVTDAALRDMTELGAPQSLHEAVSKDISMQSEEERLLSKMWELCDE
ncbi:hypothetical protein DS742_04240 [Lacrimispora amygdalina]|uniref:Uncharacterized protein n=1 Tax=Lacrimispora amygdalina TaxID=253257 RepID=A0A3E2NGN2_9FIRM|nr:hypothetical protein [Clostridium indicum]RFZ80188.1 hypothetical protein DS742_04240 [Clostridium indicum]